MNLNWDTVRFLVVFLVGIIIPMLSLTLIVMYPVSRQQRKAREADAPVGLGETSLQDEFWNFIEDVERGNVPPDQVAEATLAVAERRHRGEDPGGAAGGSKPTAAA